ncbi:extracellular solute-binding protein [Citreimonas sp.]|uniref:extracellular solute-binding protein n=1 Tax=Citreimonas sp. TaxID=3036715 RepID=UPI0035C7FC8E
MTRHAESSPAMIAQRTAPARATILAALLAGCALTATQTAAQDTMATDSAATQDDQIVTAHGYSNFDSLKYGPDFEHLEYVNPDAPKGGEISQWAQGSFDSFNRYSRRGVSASLTELLHERIMVSTADDPYGTYCYLCETLEYPESRDWVIFNLRDDVTFADGTPMTAEDVKFTFELFLEQGLAEYVNVIEGFVSEVEVLGPHRVRFNFTEDAPRREVVPFAGGSVVFSKAWFEETGARIDESSLTAFMGTGPYVIGSYDVGRRVVYERNENFWGAEHPMNVGQNNFDSIRVEYFADGAAAFEAFKAGEYTFREENSSKDWATGYDFPAVQEGHVVVEELPDGMIGTAQAWVFNLDRPTWQDPEVREAIRLMFNFEWSNRSLFYGLYDRVNSFWENSDLEATGTPTEAEVELLRPLVEDGLLDEGILTAEAVTAPENDPESNQPGRSQRREALRLMNEAGWEIGDGGLLRKDGQTMDLTILGFSAAFDRIVNPYLENLKEIGINARYERVDVSQYVRRREDGDFDMVNQSFAMGFEPGFGLRQWFGSETADNSSRNLMRLRSPAVDRLIDNVVEAETLDAMRTAVHALDRVLRAEGFWVPQWYKASHTVAYYDMFRYPEPLPPLALGELSFWWYDEDAAQELREAGAL